MKFEWETFFLSELGSIQTGKTPPKRIDNAYGVGIPFITPRDMDGRKFIRSTAPAGVFGSLAVFYSEGLVK